MKRDEIELLYPLLRLRYWQSKNNLLNNQLTYALTPFAESQFAIPAAAIPIRFKNHGLFEAALINRVAPDLAAVTSVYGHDFASPLPRRSRWKNLYRIYAPATAISWAKRRRSRIGVGSAPGAHYCRRREYVDPIIGSGELAVREWFDVGRVHDDGVPARILTVELLLRRYHGAAGADSIAVAGAGQNLSR